MSDAGAPPPAARVDRKRKLYSYVVRYDNGFAPNPFWGTCTLATCKPEIRKRAQVGDCIVGTGSKSIGLHEHLVFAMFVTETMTYSDYWKDERFSKKKPMAPIRKGNKEACGDNIYCKDQDRWRQRSSFHGEAEIETDTMVDRVLASSDFAYWGCTGPKIPDRFLQAGFSGCRNYRSNSLKHLIDDFVAWFRERGANGRLGAPACWRPLNKSSSGCSFRKRCADH